MTGQIFGETKLRRKLTCRLEIDTGAAILILA